MNRTAADEGPSLSLWLGSIAGAILTFPQAGSPHPITGMAIDCRFLPGHVHFPGARPTRRRGFFFSFYRRDRAMFSSGKGNGTDDCNGNCRPLEPSMNLVWCRTYTRQRTKRRDVKRGAYSASANVVSGWKARPKFFAARQPGSNTRGDRANTFPMRAGACRVRRLHNHTYGAAYVQEVTKAVSGLAENVRAH